MLGIPSNKHLSSCCRERSETLQPARCANTQRAMFGPVRVHTDRYGSSLPAKHSHDDSAPARHRCGTTRTRDDVICFPTMSTCKRLLVTAQSAYLPSCTPQSHAQHTCTHAQHITITTQTMAHRRKDVAPTSPSPLDSHRWLPIV